MAVKSGGYTPIDTRSEKEKQENPIPKVKKGTKVIRRCKFVKTNKF